MRGGPSTATVPDVYAMSSTMTTEVRRLESLGLVERGPDPADGRAVLVRATRAGAARHRRTKLTAREVYEAFLADWDEDDLRQVEHVAGLLVAALERRHS